MSFTLEPMFKWSRTEGYEISSIGDKKFSAFYAKHTDGRTIEEVYQCDIKGYANVKDGKGKPPLVKIGHEELWKKYLALWQDWALDHEDDVYELAMLAADAKYTLRDTFANTPINQARALAYILSKKFQID